MQIQYNTIQYICVLVCYSTCLGMPKEWMRESVVSLSYFIMPLRMRCHFNTDKTCCHTELLPAQSDV